MKPSALWKYVLLVSALASSANAGLIAYYNMEDSASPLADQEGTETAAAVGVGHLYSQPGPLGFGNAAALSDNGSWQLSVADSAELDLANNFTVMCWVYVDSATVAGKTGANLTNYRIIGDDAAWDSDGWSFGVRSTELIFTKNGVVDQISTGAAVPVDQWVHIAAVVSSTNGVTFYLNGTDNGTHADARPVKLNGTGDNPDLDPYGIGRSYGGGEAQWFAGSLDELRVYDTTLTPTEITDIMTPAAPALLAVASPLQFTNNGLADTLEIPFTNSGDSANLTVTSVTPTGGDTAFFSLSAFDNDVAPGDPGTISLDFDPTQPGGGAGTYFLTLTAVSNDAFAPSKLIEVAVEVVEPIAVVTPAVLGFGEFASSPGLQSLTVNIANDGGTEDLTINNIQLFLDNKSAFSVVGTFPMTVPAQTNVDVTINFDPGASDGYFTAELDIDTNGATDDYFTIPVSAAIALADPDASLVSLFTFDDNLNLGDDTGSYDNDGTVVGDAQQSSASRIGTGALLLDGDGDLIDLGTDTGLEYTQDLILNLEGFTAACWAIIPVASLNNQSRFFSTYMPDSFAGQGWGFGHRNATDLFATTYGLVDYFTVANTAPARGAWHHFAFVYRNDPINRIDYYVDGAMVDSQTRTQVGLNSTTLGFAIGALGNPTNGNEQYFHGRIDDLRIYNRELTGANIAALYNAAPALDDYANWIGGFPAVGAQTGFNDDPDGDDLPNGLEAFLGTDPSVPSAGLAQVTTDGTVTTVTHPQTAEPPSDVTGSYQWSLDLENWFNGDGVDGPLGGPTVSIPPVSPVGGTATATVTASEPLTRLFVRLAAAATN